LAVWGREMHIPECIETQRKWRSLKIVLRKIVR
jgi:hypothetical protein